MEFGRRASNRRRLTRVADTDPWEAARRNNAAARDHEQHRLTQEESERLRPSQSLAARISAFIDAEKRTNFRRLRSFTIADSTTVHRKELGATSREILGWYVPTYTHAPDSYDGYVMPSPQVWILADGRVVDIGRGEFRPTYPGPDMYHLHYIERFLKDAGF